jgi:hypothetical protein
VANAYSLARHPWHPFHLVVTTLRHVMLIDLRLVVPVVHMCSPLQVRVFMSRARRGLQEHGDQSARLESPLGEGAAVVRDRSATVPRKPLKYARPTHAHAHAHAHAANLAVSALTLLTHLCPLSLSLSQAYILVANRGRGEILFLQYTLGTHTTPLCAMWWRWRA